MSARKIQVIACFDAWRPLLTNIGGAGSAVGVAGMKEASDELADLMMSQRRTTLTTTSPLEVKEEEAEPLSAC
jgi:hypothetical protein